MALQVWLPLNGNIKNLGLANVATSSIETVAYDNNGKIGKCFISGGSSLTLNGINLNNNLVNILNNSNGSSVSVWIKPVGNHVHYNGTIISSGNWNGTTWTFGVSLNNSLVDVLCKGYNQYISCSVPVNEWTHLVGVYKDGISKVYKNGVYIGLKTGLPVFASDASNTCVGRETYASGYFGFNGRINDLRVYDHALSEEEIHELYLCKVIHYSLNEDSIEPTVNLGGAASNYSTVSEGVAYGASAWGGDAGTVTYYKHGGYNDGPYKVYHKTATGSGGIHRKLADDIVIEAGKTYTMSVYVKSNRDFTDSSYSFNINRGSDNNYITAGVNVHFTTNWTRITRTFTATSAQAGNYGEMSIIYDDAVTDYYVYFSCFQIEEKDHATPYVNGTRTGYCNDISGFHYNGTVNGSATISTDTKRYNKCAVFPTNTTLTCSNPFAGQTTLLEWSISCWIKATELTNWASLLNNFNSGNYLKTNTNLSILYLNSGTNDYYSYASGCPQLNEWTHVVYIFKNSTGLRLVWVNGVLKASNGPNKTSTPSGMSSAIIWFNNTGGNISDVRLYATALSADDVLKLYKLGNV